MLAPARPSLAPGACRLGVDLVDGASAVTTCSARSPARLLTPVHRGTAAWCYATSFGGGLVAGDHLDLSLTVGPSARAYCSTQASTKVYRCDGDTVARQDLVADIAAGGLLVNLPAHVTAFAGARFRARNRYRLATGASLVAVDWFSAGRSAYAAGEDWQAAELATTTTVAIDGVERIRDAIELTPTPGLPGVAARMAGFRVVATVVVIGPLLESVGATVAAEAGGPVTRQAAVQQSCSPIAGGCLWRLAGRAVEPVAQALRRGLAPVTALIGDDPWRRTF